MVQPRAGQGAVQLALRLPPEVRDRVKKAADKNGRSINSEILATLEMAYPADEFDEALFMVQFVRPIFSKQVLSQKDRDERHSMLEQANNYLSQFEEADFRLSLANVDGKEQLTFLRALTKEQAEAAYDEARATTSESEYWKEFEKALPQKSRKKAKKDHNSG